jgi:hypothetical protein
MKRKQQALLGDDYELNIPGTLVNCNMYSLRSFLLVTG